MTLAVGAGTGTGLMRAGTAAAGIETRRGTWVSAMTTVGYEVLVIKPQEGRP